MNQPALFSGPLLCHLELFPLTIVSGHHQSMITTGNKETNKRPKQKSGSSTRQRHLLPLEDFHNIVPQIVPLFYNATLSDSDKSWPSKQLVYHTLRASNRSELSLKIQFIKHRSTHISDIFMFERAFLGNFPMHWCHSLTLRTTTRTHIYSNEYLQCFLLIVVSFLTYLIISTPDKTLLIFQSMLT